MPHAQTSHSTRVSSFSLFICLAFLLAGVALQDVVFCSLTPAGSATIPQALRERSLERSISYMHMAYGTAVKYARASKAPHAACEFDLCVHVDIMRLFDLCKSKAEHGG